MIELPNLSQIGARLGERVALGMGLIDFKNHIHQGWALWVRVYDHCIQIFHARKACRGRCFLGKAVLLFGLYGKIILYVFFHFSVKLVETRK